MALQISLLDKPQFDAIRGEWNALLDRSICDSVFLRWEWIHTWWDVFQQNKRLFILTARDENRLVGLAPFYIENTGSLSLRTIKFCSEELSPDYMDLVLDSGREDEVSREIVRSLQQQHAHEWDLIALDNLRAESTLLA